MCLYYINLSIKIVKFIKFKKLVTSKMLRFVKVDKNNFEKYRHVIVNAEKFFNPKIRTPLNEYLKILDDKTQLTYLLYNHNTFCGNIIGYAQNKKSYYLFSIMVHPSQRGKGYSKELFYYFMNILKYSYDYKYLKGHYNEHSIKLLSCFKTKLIKKEKCWQGTRKEYKYIRINI